MNPIKVLLSWLLTIATMAIIFVLFISVFLSPLPPIRFDFIPKETIDFINRIKDQVIIVNRNPNPDDWTNDNAGDGYLTEYKSLQDSNFIIYYLPQPEAIKQSKQSLNDANAAILPLKDLMGIYFYPDQVNNRKLPIYITNTEKEYNAIIQQLVHCDGGGSVGVTCFELSTYGFRTLGIVLSPRAWKDKTTGLSKMVLWHEMNHYVFLTALDIRKNPAPLNWVVEGVAEYFADNKLRLNDVNKNKCNNIYLSSELKNHYDNYWVGYTVLLSAEQSYGKPTTKRFIRQNFVSTVVPTVQTIFTSDIQKFENNWRSFVVALP